MQENDTAVRNVAVFCGSNAGDDPAYADAAKKLGEVMAERQQTLIYGGGDVGLMGIIADTILARGGRAIGVIPTVLEEREVAHRGLTELRVVDGMHERKRQMYDLADAVIAMPGGIGTFDELFETLTWNQLGIMAKPCGLLNVAGYYNPLVEMVESMIHHGFLRGSLESRLQVRADPAALLDSLGA